MRCTKAQRDEAITLATQVGAAEAARRLGLNANTIRSWLSRAGNHEATVERREMTVEATKTKLATVAERKTQLASDLLDDAQRLRAQLWAPCVERKAMAISSGMRNPGHVEIVDIRRSQPTFADQRQIMTAIAIAVDKVQILTGEATERIETLEGHATPRERAEAVVNELERRRQAKAGGAA